MYKKKERTNYCACCTKLKYFETGVCSHSSQPRLDRVEVLKLLKEYFPDETAASNNLHRSCTQLSENERGRMKKQKDKFQHKWLFEESLALSKETGMWWLLYVEGQGMFCLLCRIHNTKNPFNKDSKFNSEPSVRFKRSALYNSNVQPGEKKDLGHSQSAGHVSTFLLELERRKSPLAQDYNDVLKQSDKVTYNAMLAAYWLAFEEVANSKLKSLLKLREQAGLVEMKHWTNRSERCQREQRLLIGQLIKKKVLDNIKEAQYFSILVDEVSDCAVMEQLLIYIGYVDVNGEPHFEFVEVKDCLADSDSADAETITKLITSELSECGLNLNYVCGFGSDGASVMAGSRNGVGVRLQRVCPVMVRGHCVNHRLALACGDSNDEVKFIETIEVTLRQLWYWMEHPKRCRAYIKICENLRTIQFSAANKPSLAVKVQKACRTRWLSTGQSVSSVCRNLPELLQTLRKFVALRDATADGLLRRINDVKFVGALVILNAVLPHLNSLSKIFQQNKIHYSCIKPTLQSTKANIANVRETMKPLADLKELIDGQYKDLELTLSPASEQYLTRLCVNYTNALEKNLDRRVGEAAPVLEAFSIFDPTALPKTTQPEFQSYGIESVKILAKQFIFNEEQMLAQWNNFKYVMASDSWKPPQHILSGGKATELSPTEWILRKMVREQASLELSYSFLVDSAKICLTQPISNAVVERGASAVKRIKTRLRNRMKNDMLSMLLHVSVNGPLPQSPACHEILLEASKIWRRTHKRKQPSTSLFSLPKVGGHEHAEEEKPVTCAVGVQTDAVVLGKESFDNNKI